MLSLVVLWESFTNGYRAEILDVLSLLSVFCGILVIVSKNPIVSALFLIGLFFSISCYLIILGLTFIGLSYLLVYVGAVSILFLFILMLINIRISELLTDTSNSIPLAIITCISFYYSVHPTIPYSIAPFTNYTFNTNETSSLKKSGYIKDLSKLSDVESDDGCTGIISFITTSIWDGNLSESSHITSIGNIIYTSYSIWLILTSVILLLAMVGCIIIVIKDKGGTTNPDNNIQPTRMISEHYPEK